MAVLVGRRWRRSLQARVVVTTLVASGIVVALLASLLLDQVGRGLVTTKTGSALSEAQSGLLQAQAQVGGGETRTSVVESRLQDVAQVLSERGAAGGQYTIVLSSAGGQGKAFASPGTQPADVPPVLTARLNAGEQLAYVFSDVHTPDGPQRAIVVGAELTTPVGPYRLFHVFPLTAEQNTLGLVRRTAAAAGLLLVLLLVLIAGLVTRQVVLPVRLAARTAERLADGQLEERMRVRGEDEIARLGTSFNTMASALQRQIRQLEDLSRLQQRFVSDVSHELRTPLTTVRMAADVLHEARQDFPPAAARSAELLQAQLGRFEELLAELLEISRYDAGAVPLDPGRLDLLVLVDRVAQALGPLADRRGSALLVHATGPAEAEVDHVRVERILRNLVVNAIEHGEGRPVEITVSGSRSCAAVLVRDHGVGLAPGESALVFTRFWRGDPSRARTTGGTGLGLAIAFEDARLHGGRLQAWGAPGQGAAFLLTLPVMVGEAMGQSPLPLVPAHVTPVPS